jgi:methylphosphotriester-DNA--protein-cysteine methyltransferase
VEESTTQPGWETADGFVASKNSAVFHKPDCRIALKVARANVIRYASREEAEHDGKRACPECRPWAERPLD